MAVALCWPMRVRQLPYPSSARECLNQLKASFRWTASRRTRIRGIFAALGSRYGRRSRQFRISYPENLHFVIISQWFRNYFAMISKNVLFLFQCPLEISTLLFCGLSVFRSVSKVNKRQDSKCRSPSRRDYLQSR